MSLIAELKRRNVFRVAALYLVAAWVLLQVGLPSWTNKKTSLTRFAFGPVPA